MIFKPKLHDLVPELANLTEEDMEELTDRNRRCWEDEDEDEEE